MNPAETGAIVERLNDPLLLLDGDGNIHYANPAAQRLLSLNGDDLAAAQFVDCLHPDDVRVFNSQFGRTAGGAQRSTTVVLHILTSDGVNRVYDATISEYFDHDSSAAVMVLLHDVTVRHSTESALRENVRLAQSFQDNAAAGVYRSNVEGKFLYANREMARLLDVDSPEELLSEHQSTEYYFDPKDRVRMLHLARSQDKIDGMELRLKTAKGRLIWVRLTSKTIRNKFGRVEFIEGFVVDVTEQKLTESALRVSRARFAGILEIAQEAIISVNDKHEIIIFNKGAERMFGYAADQVLGRTFEFLTPPRYRGVYDRYVDQLVRAGHSSHVLSVRRPIGALHKNGRQFPVKASISVLTIEGETIYTTVLRDLTEMERTVTQKQMFEDLVQNMIVGSFVYRLVDARDSSSLMFLSANKFAGRILNLNPDEIIGKNILEVFPNLKDSIMLETFASVVRQQQTVELGEVAYEDDRIGYAMYFVRAFPLPGRCVGVAFEDITERKLLEGSLAQSQKMESIGQLASGVAHEINTPIQYISDNLAFLQSGFNDLLRYTDELGELLNKVSGSDGDSEEVKELKKATDLNFNMLEIPTAIEQSMEGAQRVSRIVGALKEFAHPGGREKTFIDVNRAIASTISVTQNEWKYVAELETDLDESLPTVPVIADEFNLAVMNIIINAAHAIEEAQQGRADSTGSIRISSRLVGSSVEVRIADNGTGIPPRNRDKIFDPFFTTKEVGKGTGQGLSLAYKSIVEHHGGQLTFETELGRGTEFIITLPLERSTGPAQQDEDGESAVDEISAAYAAESQTEHVDEGVRAIS